MYDGYSRAAVIPCLKNCIFGIMFFPGEGRAYFKIYSVTSPWRTLSGPKKVPAIAGVLYIELVFRMSKIGWASYSTSRGEM